ncbi:MAG: aldehyde dehydrogenase (NADP(+)), partial [Chitinophagaceae bacterium]
LMATVYEEKASQELIRLLEQRCGRLIFNGVPTGVEVCKSMHHGGPFPATTDSRFGAVGADAIKRFIRPLAYQNWPEELLPDYLQDNSLTSIPRYRNGVIE